MSIHSLQRMRCSCRYPQYTCILTNFLCCSFFLQLLHLFILLGKFSNTVTRLTLWSLQKYGKLIILPPYFLESCIKILRTFWKITWQLLAAASTVSNSMKANPFMSPDVLYFGRLTYRISPYLEKWFLTHSWSTVWGRPSWNITIIKDYNTEEE